MSDLLWTTRRTEVMIAVMGSPTVALESHSQSEGGRGREMECERQRGGFVWSAGSEKMNVPLCVMNVQLGGEPGCCCGSGTVEPVGLSASQQPASWRVQQRDGVRVYVGVRLQLTLEGRSEDARVPH